MRGNKYGDAVNRTPEMEEKLKKADEFIFKIGGAIQLMREGCSENMAANEMGLNRQHLRRFILNVTKDENPERITMEGITSDLFLTPAENLLYDVLGEKRGLHYENVPYDIEQTWNYIFPLVLKKREIATVREYYWEGHTLEETAKSHGVTRERVRQILAVSLRKLKEADRKQYKGYLYSGMHHRTIANLNKKSMQIKQRQCEITEKLLDIIPDNDQPKKLAMIEACRQIDEDFSVEDAIKKYKPSITMEYILNTEVLSVRTYNAIKRNYDWRRCEGKKLTLSSVIFDFSPDDLMKCRNLGRKSYEELKGVLYKYGWSEEMFY